MELDLQHGVTMVSGKGDATQEGLGIGPPLVAGAATLAAARLEEMTLRDENVSIREELLRKTFIKRWTDDVLVVVEGRSQSAQPRR